jgi:signal transduction histidine kinase
MNKLFLQILLFVLAVAMSITLLVLWNVYLVSDYSTIKEFAGEGYDDGTRWGVLALGCVFFTFIIFLLSIYFANILKSRRNQKTQSEFINLTTHELKLPLSNIQLLIETIQTRKLTPAKHDEFVDIIGKETQGLHTLVEHLLQARKMDGGRLKMETKETDMDSYLEEFASEWQGKLELQIDARPVLEIDPYYFDILLSNLVRNAQAYAPANPPKLHLYNLSKTVILDCIDQGSGVPQSECKKIFKRFYRARSHQKQYRKGTGLGLYIANKITQSHKGQISALHQKAGFTIRLQFHQKNNHAS